MSLRPLAQALRHESEPARAPFRQQGGVAGRRRSTGRRDPAEGARRWLARTPDLSQADQLRRWWKWINASPANLALVRLGLEAASLEATVTGLPGDVRADQIGLWRSHIEQRLLQHGFSPQDASIEASLAKATFTGLIIDLMATGDRRRLTKSLDVALARLDEMIAVAERGKAAS